MTTEMDEADESTISVKIDEYLQKIEEVDQEINIEINHSRDLVPQIYDVSRELEEARFLQNRYKALHSQYSSDIKRLQFIDDGEEKIGHVAKLKRCPFCDNSRNCY